MAFAAFGLAMVVVTVGLAWVAGASAVVAVVGVAEERRAVASVVVLEQLRLVGSEATSPSELVPVSSKSGWGLSSGRWV